MKAQIVFLQNDMFGLSKLFWNSLLQREDENKNI